MMITLVTGKENKGTAKIKECEISLVEMERPHSICWEVHRLNKKKRVQQ
jgi:hypothetical protein